MASGHLREALKEDATEKEIRDDELYRMIETEFLPFDYTIAAYEQYTGSAFPSMKGADSTSEAGVRPSGTQPSNMLNGNSESGNQPLTTTSTNGTTVNHTKSSTKPSPGKSSGPRAPNFSQPNPTTPPVPRVPQRNPNRKPSMSRMASGSGGVQVVLNETSSWSDLAKQDATLPADARDLTTKPNGMLGFLNRKKGRSHSPKPQEPGVLGKEGARVVMGSS